MKCNTPYDKWENNFEPKSGDLYPDHRKKLGEIQYQYHEFFDFYLGNIYSIPSTDITYREIKVVDKMTKEEVIFRLSIYNFLDEEKSYTDLVLPHFYRFINKYQNQDIINGESKNNNISKEEIKAEIEKEIEKRIENNNSDIINKNIDISSKMEQTLLDYEALEFLANLDISNKTLDLSQTINLITEGCKRKYFGWENNKENIYKILFMIRRCFKELELSNIVEVFGYQTEEDIEKHDLHFYYCDVGTSGKNIELLEKQYRNKLELYL